MKRHGISFMVVSALSIVALVYFSITAISVWERSGLSLPMIATALSGFVVGMSAMVATAGAFLFFRRAVSEVRVTQTGATLYLMGGPSLNPVSTTDPKLIIVFYRGDPHWEFTLLKAGGKFWVSPGAKLWPNPTFQRTAARPLN